MSVYHGLLFVCLFFSFKEKEGVSLIAHAIARKYPKDKDILNLSMPEIFSVENLLQ